MAKKLIAFDIDDTLVVTKSPITDRMGGLLVSLLEKYDVCIISGSMYELILENIVNRLSAPAELLSRLHVMPTCGLRYYSYSQQSNQWELQYANDLTDEQKQRTVEALESTAKEMGIWEPNPAGEIIEDRQSQITMSALGQQAKPEDKYAWAEKNKELRFEFRDKVAAKIPDLEVRLGGTTSTDVTMPGIDKSYGIGKLIERLNITTNEVLFMGDKLEEGGNDYPVKQMGIDSIAVRSWEDTAYAIEGVLGVTE